MKNLLLVIGFLFCTGLSAQQVSKDSAYITSNVASAADFGVKNPLRASLYSAVLPGMGQVYNEKFWKVPLVWGIIGTGLGVTLHYNDRYNHYRNAFLAELEGQDHPYVGVFDKDRLGAIQDDMRRNRDYAIALTIVGYALNILDATVDAHLYEIRKDSDLSIDPTAFVDPATGKTNVGLAFKLKLN